MAEMTKKEMLEIVESNISKLENKEFNVYFFVLDTKGNPTSALEYIYQTALCLKNKGYKVGMIHNEKEFVGVGGWLGEEYANLPHYNVEKINVEISPCDFLFIPEIFANVMMQTKQLPCKRVVLVQNYRHITEFLPVSQTMKSLGISDIIATTDTQANKFKEFFPEVRSHIVHPSIKSIFRDNQAPRKLVVNLICKDQSKKNEIMKSFYWKNPIYRFVSFRDLAGMPQDLFSDCLRENAITIWEDDETPFGYTLLEALRCGSLVLAKIPTHPTEWMLDDDGNLTQSVIWFEDNDDLPNILVSAVRSWTLDAIPEDAYTSQKAFNDKYSEKSQETEIDYVYVKGLFERRLNEFKEVKVDVENNVFKTKDE